MSGAFAVKPETGIFDHLLSLLPNFLSKDPQAEAGVTLAYDGSAGTVSIAQKQLSTTVTGGTGEPLVIDLDGLTLQDVSDTLNSQQGYSSAVGNVNPDISALTLIPVQGQQFFSSPMLRVTRSLLWRLLLPFVWELETLKKFDEDLGNQFAIRSSGGKWLDYNGDIYGGVRRLFNEDDPEYATRMLKEVQRWRLNEYALAEIVQERFGIPTSIRNLHDQAWVWNRTHYGKYAGRKYSRTTFEVDPQVEVDPSIRYLIERNKAAGTLAYYITRIVVGMRRLVRAGSATTRQQSILLFGRAAPENRIAGVTTEHAVRVIETSLFGVGGAFTVGTSLLGGADLLGGSGSISLSDTTTGVLE